MTTLYNKLNTDTQTLVNRINQHHLSQTIKQVFKKGPPKQNRYFWGLNIPDYWTTEEKKAINIIHAWILQKGWECGGYSIIFNSIKRNLQ
jgi:broad specificity polyphosphatase/5'/3'-nucleotidase SurE